MTADSDESGQSVWRKDEAISLILEVVAELAPEEGEVLPAGRLIEDFGYHSLALLELAFSLEDEFDLETIDEATARKIVTVQDVIDHVMNELGDKRMLV